VNDLEKAYRQRAKAVLPSVASAIEAQLRDYLAGEPRIDRVSARVKSVDSFMKKAWTEVEGKPKYADPLRQVQDQIGARIVTFYRSDIDRIARLVDKYYRPIETKEVVPDHDWKFGYFGRHFVLVVPSDVIGPELDHSKLPKVFELQIKTLFQHAWSEANHDLGYKPSLAPLDPEDERKLAFTAAQAWGADQIFDELYRGLAGLKTHGESLDA
jgi:putative GTP pyrophosphokinase